MLSTEGRIRCPSGDDIGGHTMFGFGHDTGVIKRFARAFIALVFITATIAPSYAQTVAAGTSSQRGAASYAGPTAMLGVRIPFGGEAKTSSQGIVGLRFGSSWRADLGSTGPQASRFMSTIEAGLSLRGDPILRLNSFEVRLDGLRAAAEGAQGEGFCGRNVGVCIAGGVALAAVVVFALAGGSDDCDAEGEYPPGQHPCRCYELDGC